MALSEAEVARYARQLILPGLGPVAQEFLRSARVHVVGAGEVAGPALVYLAQAGVGTLYVDDGGDVGAEDGAAWLYGAEKVGEPRLLSAMEALRGVNRFVKPRAYATGADPTATLICAGGPGIAREAAERARAAGLPHVVALADGDGGEVVSIPPGAPCYNCGSRPGSGAPPRSGAGAAVGTLGALELLLVLGGVSQGPIGRRVELVLGEPQARPTTRIPGCACGRSLGA